jgi:hypothetical protein
MVYKYFVCLISQIYRVILKILKGEPAAVKPSVFCVVFPRSLFIIVVSVFHLRILTTPLIIQLASGLHMLLEYLLQARKSSCHIYVCLVYRLSLCDFFIGFRNCSDSVILIFVTQNLPCAWL